MSSLLLLLLFTVSVPVMAQGPSIALSKSVAPATVDAGETVIYTIMLENSGDIVGDEVQVVDALPDGFVYQSGSSVIRSNGTIISVADPAISGNELTWSSLSVPAARRGSFYGMHTFIQDKCKKGYIEYQLDRVRELMGPGAYVKQLFYYITPEMTAPLSCWVDFVNEAYDRDLIPIVRLQGVHGGQYWVKPAPDSPGDYTSIASVYRRIVEDLPRRDDQPLYVEIWNEPNLDIEWSGEANPVEYAEFLVDVAAAIRSIGDSRIRILNGGLSPGGNYHNLAYIDAMATVPGALDAFDVWSTHPYSGNHPPEYNIHDDTAVYPDLTIDSYLLELQRLANNGRGGVQVILTEAGHALGQNNFWFEGYAPIGEENRADYISRAFRDYWSQWPEILGVCPYELVDPYGNWWPWDWLYPDTRHHWQYDAVLALDKSVLPEPGGVLTIEFRATAPSSGGWFYNDVTATASNASIGSALHTARVFVVTPLPTATPTPTATPGTPTPTLHPSITPTVTPTPICTDLIVNGSFETGSIEPGQAWEPLVPDDIYVVLSTEDAYDRTRSVRLGILSGKNLFRYSSVRQIVNLPADAGNAMLSFWYRPVSDNPDNDWGYAYIRRVDEPVGDVHFLDLSLDDWEQHDLDLTDYVGDTIEVRFSVKNDGSDGLTAMYVDLVSLLTCGVCGTPTPTSTHVPSPTPSPSVVVTATETPSPTTTETLAPTVTPTRTPAATASPTSTPSLPPTESPTATRTPSIAPSVTASLTVEPTLPVPTPTPTVGCWEQIENGGFEDEDGWVILDTDWWAGYATNETHSEARSMRLGIVSGDNVESYSSVEQTLTLPADATRLHLSFWVYPQSEDAAGDLQYVLLMEERGGYSFLMSLTSDARSWQYQEFSLLEYAGETITLRFSVYNNGNGGRAAMYVDDVSLLACSGELPVTPTPTPSAAVTATSTATRVSTVSPEPTPTQTPVGDAYVLRTIPVGRHPHGVAVDSLMGLVYTANYLDGTVSVVDAVAGTVLGQIDLKGSSGSNGIAINPALRRAYVANSFSDSVSVIDLDERRLVVTVPVQELPNGVAVDTASSSVYVACFGSSSVAVLDGLNDTLVATVPVGMEPSMIAVSSRRREVYVTNHHHLFNSVAVIDTVPNIAIDSLSAGGGPYGVAFDSESDIIYTANRDGHSVSAISRDGTRLAEVPLDSSVYVVGYNPNTHHLFALCSDLNVVHVIDGTSFEVLATLPVGNEAEEGMAIDRATNRVYITNGGDDTLTVIQDVGPLPEAQDVMLPLLLKGFIHPHVASRTSSAAHAATEGQARLLDTESIWVAVPAAGGISGVAVDTETGASYYVGEGGLAKLDGHGQRGWYRSCPALVDVEVRSGRVFATSWEAGALLVFDASDGTLLSKITGFVRPSGVAVGMGRIFVADTGADCLVVLDELSCGILESLPVDDAPGVVVVNEFSGVVYVVSTGGNCVAAFDARSGRGIGRVSMEGLGYPQSMAVDCSTDRLFVVYSVSPKRQSVAVLDGRDMQLVSNFTLDHVGVSGSIYALAMDDISRRLYVSTSDGLLTLDSATGRVLGHMPSVVTQSPFGLALDADTRRLFVADLRGGPVMVVQAHSER
ncbi:MAG: SMP-30/gluconolactonase/LRE family protein [Chloroflexota bacterium]